MFTCDVVEDGKPLPITELVAIYIYVAALLGGFAFLQRVPVTASFSPVVLVYPILYLYFSYKFFMLHKHKWFMSFPILTTIPFFGLLLSSMYSHSPYNSVFSVISLMMNCIFTFVVFIRIGIDKFFHIIFNTIVSLHLLAVPFALLNIDYVIYTDPMDRASLLGLKNYAALFPHKIQAGLYSALGAYIGYYLYLDKKNKKYIYTSAFLTIMVLASGSSLAAVVFVLAAIFPIICRLIIRYLGVGGVIYFFLCLCLCTFCFFYFDLYGSFLLFLGREPSLTGRTEIWAFGLKYISEHLVLGGGLGVFFEQSPLSPAQELWRQMQWYRAPSFHNGYIELFAENGVLTGFFFVFVLFYTLIKSMCNSKPRSNLYAHVVLLVILSNAAAAVFVKANVLFIVIIFMIFCSYFFESKNVQSLANKTSL